MVIFDFDQTLVDTSPVAHLRRPGGWSKVMAAAPQLVIYDGVHELLAALHAAGRPTAILTHSPDMVPKRFIEQHNWPISTVIGYHQLKQRKPHPDGILQAMAKAGVKPRDVVHVGDAAHDTAAARAAGVVSVGAAWGIDDVSELRASKPDYLFTEIAELRNFLSLP